MKKIDKNYMLRVQSVLENDRLTTGKGFNELLTNDLNKLLKEYFDYSKDVDLIITKEQGGYKVEFSLFTTRIKAFNYLPKQ